MMMVMTSIWVMMGDDKHMGDDGDDKHMGDGLYKSKLQYTTWQLGTMCACV